MPFISHSAPKQFYLAMHVIGLLTKADRQQRQQLEELDDMVQSSAVMFSSRHSGKNVHKITTA